MANNIQESGEQMNFIIGVSCKTNLYHDKFFIAKK